MALIEPSSLPVPHRPPAVVASLGSGPTVVRLRGEYDLTTVPALGETLARAMAQGDTDLMIDLSEVQFMDAATIGVITRARNRLRARSRSLTLGSAAPSPRRVLDLCHLTGLVVGSDAAASKLCIADPAGYPVTAEAALSVPDADLLAARHATDVARRRVP